MWIWLKLWPRILIYKALICIEFDSWIRLRKKVQFDSVCKDFYKNPATFKKNCNILVQKDLIYVGVRRIGENFRQRSWFCLGQSSQGKQVTIPTLTLIVWKQFLVISSFKHWVSGRFDKIPTLISLRYPLLCERSCFRIKKTIILTT
jgi:hypothetical protein